MPFGNYRVTGFVNAGRKTETARDADGNAVTLTTVFNSDSATGDNFFDGNGPTTKTESQETTKITSFESTANFFGSTFTRKAYTSTIPAETITFPLNEAGDTFSTTSASDTFKDTDSQWEPGFRDYTKPEDKIGIGFNFVYAVYGIGVLITSMPNGDNEVGILYNNLIKNNSTYTTKVDAAKLDTTTEFTSLRNLGGEPDATVTFGGLTRADITDFAFGRIDTLNLTFISNSFCNSTSNTANDGSIFINPIEEKLYGMASIDFGGDSTIFGTDSSNVYTGENSFIYRDTRLPIAYPSTTKINGVKMSFDNVYSEVFWTKNNNTGIATWKWENNGLGTSEVIRNFGGGGGLGVVLGNWREKYLGSKPTIKFSSTENVTLNNIGEKGDEGLKNTRITIDGDNKTGTVIFPNTSFETVINEPFNFSKTNQEKYYRAGTGTGDNAYAVAAGRFNTNDLWFFQQIGV